jgi:hypothetical protein
MKLAIAILVAALSISVVGCNGNDDAAGAPPSSEGTGEDKSGAGKCQMQVSGDGNVSDFLGADEVTLDHCYLASFQPERSNDDGSKTQAYAAVYADSCSPTDDPCPPGTVQIALNYALGEQWSTGTFDQTPLSGAELAAQSATIVRVHFDLGKPASGQPAVWECSNDTRGRALPGSFQLSVSSASYNGLEQSLHGSIHAVCSPDPILTNITGDVTIDGSF